MEKEKLRECLKGLEREKIARGIMCTKEDEKELKQMQRLQMIEKKNIERQEQDIDMLWHHLQEEEVKQKEHKERVDEERRQREMVDRRKAYDEQIASANKKRQEALREEREKENRRLERMKKKMEQDHYELINKKKNQQNLNKTNFIEGHQMKMTRLREEKTRAREIDNGTIRAALEDLERERERNRIQMRNLQVHKQIFVENFNRERRTAVELEEEAAKIAQEWKQQQENKTDEQLLKIEEERRRRKEQAFQDYKKHLNNTLVEAQTVKQARREQMEQVNRTAYNELQRQLDSAKDELRQQVDYRNSLTCQLRDNQRIMKVELIEMIRAKRYCSEKDLESIVNRVKMERKANAQLKRKQKKKSLRLQGTEVSSTSQSPSITLTPVRPSEYVIRYSSQSPLDIMNNNPRPSVVDAGAPFLHKYKSDRVLRSFSSMRRPNYRILDQTDCVVGVVKSRNTIKEIRHQERIQQIQEIHQERAFQSINVHEEQRPLVNALRLKGDRQRVPVIPRSVNNGPNPAKRHRKISGIYPLECQGRPQYDMPTVNFRQSDGRVCKINAVIQRPLANTLLPKNHAFLQKKSLVRSVSTANVNPSQCVTVQDVINYEVERPTLDLAGPRAMETNKVHDIDHFNAIDRPSYERKHVNRQIEPMIKSRHIEQSLQDYQSNSNRGYDQNNPNALKLSYQGRTLFNIVPENTTERDQNRKVSKNCQTSNARKRWSIEIDGEPKIKRAKSNNTTDGHTSQCFSHKAKEYRNHVPASTNIKVVPKIISAPMSREPRYDQEIRDKNMEHARNMEYARNAEHARNVDHARYMDYTRSSEHSMNMEDVYTRHEDYARNTIGGCTELARADHARNVDPNNNHARNAEHARNTDHRAIEPPRTETDLRSQYPNMSSLTDVLPNEDYTQHTDLQSQFSVHYHKEIKAEQLRGNTLPRINDVFSQFNEAYKKLAPSLYAKVGEESERVPLPTTNVNTCLLERLYNFKIQFLTNPPLRRIVRSQTNCTFSTNTVPTAVEQSTAAEYSNHCNPYERVNAYELYNGSYQSRFNEYPKQVQPDVVFDEGTDSPTVTIGSQASQDIDNDNVAVPSPEMVDDALELISQDGDYMERIGMDVRVQCILCCDWAGPKFILEYHIKKEHPQAIHHISSPTSRVQLSLTRSLGARAWSSQLLQYQDTLYALSAQRNETSLLLAFSAIPNELEIPRRCRITISNDRLKHQPNCYECDILHIPDSMPYEYGQECLALDLASLGLMPNSLAHREIVGSPGEEQPELDNVELAVYIQLFD